MNVRHRLLSLAASAALTTTVAAGQGITIDGPQGHSTAAPVEANGSVEEIISYWEYGTGRQSQIPPSGRTSRPAWATRRPAMGTRYGSNILYAGGFSIRHGVDLRRGTFRYRIKEYQKLRFSNLKPNTQGARFKVSKSNYSPGTRYTSSFNGRNRFASTIRYGYR